jgi:hypothetical protein
MRILPIVSILCFSLLFTFTAAQQPTPEQVQQQIAEQLRYLQSPRQQVHWEADQLAGTRSTWNGKGAWIPLGIMLRSGGESELGLTEEQKQRFVSLYRGDNMGREVGQRLRENPPPEMFQAMEVYQATLLPDDPLFERATEEQKTAFRNATIGQMNFLVEALQKEVEETLTPEQMLQVRKLEMQLMPAMCIPFPSMFEPLDLTDEQKEAMDKIAEEMKVEFDRLTLEEAKLKGERLIATYGLLDGKTFASNEEFQKARQEIHRQFVPSEEMRKKALDLRERGSKFTTLLQDRLMNVLTDEQLDKMQKIMDASPEFAKKIIAESKAQREAQERSPVWVPGPDSWRPGMPQPVQYKEERRTGRFPRSEQID